MAVMSTYCKAYSAEQLRQFPSWSEDIPPLLVSATQETDDEADADEQWRAPCDAGYYFLHDNFNVTASIFRDQKIAFDRVTEEWKSFCANHLKFQQARRTG